MKDDIRQLALRPYQLRMREHQLAYPRNNSWGGMGVGKTITKLSALDLLYLSGKETKPTLVVAPLRVARSVWPDEAAKWQHILSTIEVQPVLGTPLAREKALRNTNASVFAVNFDNLPWLVEHLGDKWPFGPVVIDEATRLKSWRGSYLTHHKTGKLFLRCDGGQRTRAIARVERFCSRWTNLTGTPAPNGLLDLWGQCWFLDHGQRLGRTFNDFAQRWFRPHPSGYGVEPLPCAQHEIEARLADISLSIDHDLPVHEPIVNRIVVELPMKAREMYRRMEREMFAHIDGHAIEAFNAAGRSLKCLQLANGAAYTDDTATQWTEVHDEKIRALESVVTEANGIPVLVAYHFRSDLARLRAAFPRARVLDADPQTIRDWNAGRIPILLAHPASAGHGLNLQDGGNILVFFGLWWGLEEHQQIIERIGPVRQAQAGHNRPVFIHYIVARNTVDEAVLLRLHTKKSIQEVLVEAMKRSDDAQ